MTTNDKQKEDFWTDFWASVIAGLFLAVPFFLFGVFYLFKRPLSKALNLEERSLQWESWRWMLVPLQLAACAAFVYAAVQIALFVFRSEPISSQEMLYAVIYVSAAFVAGCVFNLIHWTAQCYRTPAIQKKLAGLQAEQFVSQMIDRHLKHYAGAHALHGALFVFNSGLPNEFSVEVDHLLITARHVFVIETKYKSGTITASASASHWEVATPQGQATMRNALKQAKNAAQVIERECHLPCAPIPIVAIKGKDLLLQQSPTNVVSADDISRVIHAFEASQPSTSFTTDHVLALLKRHVTSDKAALARHIARAEQAKDREAIARIVESASIR